MTSGRNAFRIGLLLAIVPLLTTPAARATVPFGAPQATELWGGPAAKGVGASGSRYETTVTITAVLAQATGTVDYWAGGALKATVPFSISPRGVVAIPTPAALDGAGPFLYHVLSDVAVIAYSETYNDTSNGRYGLSVPAFTTADLISAGDEASGGGGEDSTDPTRSRTNVGVLCVPNSAAPCQLEVSAFASGSLLGIGTVTAAPGAANQASISSIVPGASGMRDLGLRLRMLNGLGLPYAIKNDNRTSDGTQIPLSVSRGAFSTAPNVTSFTSTPDSGCAPLSVTLTWTTTGASKVTISGVSGDLPANGTTTVSLLTTTDLVLTATAPTGATTSVPRHVSITPPPNPPTPAPASVVVATNATVTGIIPPSPAGTVTADYVTQGSTGSSFTLTGNNWVYVAGPVPGTDVVRITAQTLCGPVTADFTATVLTPGAPAILSFTADPPVGCAPQNVVLSWTTMDATSVTITGIDGILSANGSIAYPTPLTAQGTFTLTARSATGQTVKSTILVPVDTAPPSPVLSPNNQILHPGDSVNVLYSGPTPIGKLGIVTVQNQSGGTFRASSGGFVYTAGGNLGVDIFRVYDHNGCGYNYATFQAQIVAP